MVSILRSIGASNPGFLLVQRAVGADDLFDSGMNPIEYEPLNRGVSPA